MARPSDAPTMLGTVLIFLIAIGMLFLPVVVYFALTLVYAVRSAR